MDAAAPPRLLESSPQKLVVGVRDAGLGWVEIRTHAAAGQVAATLATGSQDAHAALAAALPAIRDTLANQHIAVHSLSAEQFPASSGGDSSASHAPDSGSADRQSFVKPKGDSLPEAGEAEGESLSYINVRV
jgi:flagellar hook-length control protein FliK